jgi:hypothetical protein
MTAETHGSVPAAPREGVRDGRLADLVENLARARRRSLLRTFLDGLITSIAIGLALFVVLELLYLILGNLAPILSFEWLAVPAWLADWRPSPVPQHMVVAVIGAVAALVVAQFAAAAHRPGIGRMARAADRRFAMEERLSTALELAQSPNKSPGVIREALLQDAARRASDVDIRRLAPMRLQWQALAVPVLALIAALIVINPPTPVVIGGTSGSSTTVGGNAGGTTATMTPDERAETAGQLRAIAAILAQDGQARLDTTLQAVANELLALGDQIENNPAIDRAALGDELQRLLDATNNAYAQAGVNPGDAANRTQLIDNAIRAVDPNRYQVADGGASGAGGAAPDGLETPREHMGLDGANVPTEGAITLPRTAEVAAENANVVEGANVPDELNHNFAGEPDNPYDEDSAVIDNVAVNPEVAVVGFGEGAGGDLAGRGAAELFDAAGNPINPGPTDGEITLMDADPGNGRMITLNLPPVTELMPVDTNGLQTGVWQPLNEHEVTRTEVPAAALDVVGRYFQMLQAENAE